MKKFKIFIFLNLIIFLTSCSTVKEGFVNQKKNSSDEFLVQKKSPLVMPPEFDVLPIPKESKSEDESGNKSVEKLITGSNSITSENKTDKTKKFNSSIEKLILEKIKNN